MKRAVLKFALLAIAWNLSSFISSQAQGTFQFQLWEQQPSAQFWGGFGSFSVDPSVGLFQVDVVAPYETDSFSPVLATSSGSLIFSLGTGVPVWIQLDAFGDGTYGTEYIGSFVSSPAIFSDLSAGLGELRLISDSPPVTLSGSVVPVPEPSAGVLFLCGISAVLCRGARKHDHPRS
jgi:hypothetical protein